MTVQRPRSCRRVIASPAVPLGIAQALPTSQERGRDLNPFNKRSQSMTPLYTIQLFTGKRIWIGHATTIPLQSANRWPDPSPPHGRLQHQAT